MPKKLKPENNKRLDYLFGNMVKDSKRLQNLKKNEPEKKNEKSSKEKIKSKKEEEKINKKNEKSKIKISEKEKEEEKKNKLKSTKKIEKKEKIEKNEKIEKKEKSNSKKKKLKKNKLEEDDEEYEDTIKFSDYKMEIEEEKEIINKANINKKVSKANKSNSKDKNIKDNNNKNKNKKSKIVFDEDIDNDIDFDQLENVMKDEEEETIKEKENDKGKANKKNNKSRSQSTNKKNKRNKSKDVKSTTNKKRGKKDTASSDSNIIEGPLSDETIVITGEFDLKREEITQILKSLGARVTGSVSSRTTILLHGDQLEDGRPYTEGRKYRQAVEKNVKTLDLSSFEQYVQKKTKNPNWSFDTNNNNLDLDLEIEEEIPNNSNKNKNKGKTDKSKDKDNNKNNIKNQDELWTTKYQPKKISELIGNKTNINKLISWLDDWNSVVLEGNKKKVETKFHKGQRPTFENLNARACLITGDPGIGKTSSVRLIAKLKGYKTFETNASDQRNKNSINKNAGFMFDNKTLFGGELQDKNLIIMDEVDGMSGNEDRGGIAAIIDIIKKTKTPIICIANDRQNPKLRSLANYCYDIKFVHPDKRQIALRLAEICKNENIQCEFNALEHICEICGNDVRQIMNFIELWTRNHKTIKFKDLTGGDQKIEGKDEVVMLKNFDAAKELLNSKSHSLPYRQLLDLYFIDYDLIPLLIQENYLSTFPSQNYKNKKEELESISLAADLISESDVIDKQIRTNMDWRLLADRGLIGCCTICKLNKGFVPFPKFPEALGKISALNKKKRETNELKECFISASGEEIRRQILPVMYTYLIDYIVDGDIDGVLEMMKKNHITMDLFKENMTDLASEKLKLAFEKIGTANKSNLTRAYNKNFKSSVIRVKNKKGKNKSSVSVNVSKEKVYDENGNLLNEIEEEIEEENDEESSDFVVDTRKGKTQTRGKGKGNKSRNRSKSQDNEKKNKNNKSGKSKSKDKEKEKDKGKNKSKAGKGKKNKKRKNKDEYEEDEDDDDDYDI